jgi:hypothetical protein
MRPYVWRKTPMTPQIHLHGRQLAPLDLRTLYGRMP